MGRYIMSRVQPAHALIFIKLTPSREATQFNTKLSRNKSYRDDRMSDFHPYFDIRHNLNGRAVSYTRRPHFTAKEVPWYSFLLGAECGQKDLVTWNLPTTPPGIKTGTSHLVAQCLNQLCQFPPPRFNMSFMKRESTPRMRLS